MQNGYYSVRAGYYAAGELKKKRSAASIASASSNVAKKYWSFVWKIQVPNKVRVFLWRLLTNGLPVLENMSKRKMHVNVLCSVCLEQSESIMHTFCHCQFARLTWATSGLPAALFYRNVANVWDWIVDIKQVTSADQFAHFVCICWSIWYHRNDLVHNGKNGDALELISFAADYLDRYQAA